MAVAAPSLNGQAALGTRGGRGVGPAVARGPAAAGAAGGRAGGGAAGAAVTVLGRRADVLRAAVAAGAARRWIAADVAEDLPPLPGCDILVNAAGAAESAAFLQTDAALWQRMLAVNLLGAAAVSRA